VVTEDSCAAAWHHVDIALASQEISTFYKTQSFNQYPPHISPLSLS
jgi:hypothetical protein